MMEEVSTTMQCDFYDMERMSEEEILACLVADTEPKFTVRIPGLIHIWVWIQSPASRINSWTRAINP